MKDEGGETPRIGEKEMRRRSWKSSLTGASQGGLMGIMTTENPSRGVFFVCVLFLI